MTSRLLAAAMGICFTAQAQPDTSGYAAITLDELVFSAGKFPEHKKNIAQPVRLISRREMEWYSPPTSAGLLEQTGQVFVQRSQLGGGSPVLRGLEASRVLLVIDGVRMNNAIYRAGHLQNVITLDNNILERTEILYGPSSTIYGSDALGGVVVFNTRQPRFASGDKVHTAANAMVRYSTAANEQTGHADFNIGGRRLASLTSITYSRFGDLRQGNFRNPFNPDFGKRTEYVARINGQDSVVRNNDPNVQKFSGYNQIDLLQKFLFKQNDRIQHGLNLQYSTSSDVPRYDRLTDRRNGQLRWAEWYYGPQERMMAAYHLDIRNPLSGWFDEAKAVASYQWIEESRHQRLFGNDNRQSRTEQLGVAGLNIDMRKIMGRHELTTGLDAQYNDVQSAAFTKNLVDGTRGSLDTRYPDGGSNMFYGSVYAQHLFRIIPDKLVLNDGLRLNYTHMHTQFNDTSFFPFPYREADQQHLAWSGNLGLVYMPADRWRTSFTVSSGFRAPNVDDMAKVFESAGGVQLVVPNPDLKPEYTYNVDIGIAYMDNRIVKMELNGFYTWFRNAIVLDRFTLNGQDSIAYNGANTLVVALQNKARATLHGLSASLTVKPLTGITLHSTITYTYGRYFDPLDNRMPLDHIPPVYGKTSILWQQDWLTGEFFALYNGWKLLKDYNPFGEDNLQYATAEGMPAWYTLNVRAGARMNNYFSIQVALENILDYNYRVFASGIHAPGRNLVITLKGRF